MLQALALTLLSLSHQATALALPQVTTGSDLQLFPSNTTITYYQGIALATEPIQRGVPVGQLSDPPKKRDTGACGMSVGSGTIQQGTCIDLYTAAIGLQQTEAGSCSFTLYPDVNGCDPGPNGTTDSKRVVAIPNGEGTTCVGTGVLDGGKFYKASGIWVCG